MIRTSWGPWINRIADGEPVLLTFRNTPSAALLPPDVWEQACTKLGTPPTVVELGSSPARRELATRRDAARSTGEHTLIRDGNSRKPMAVLTPVDWARTALGTAD